MTVKLNLADRTALAQTLITRAGSGAKLKWYNGTEPSGMGAVTGGNTLLSTDTFGTTCGTATNGTLDFDEAGVTQSAGSNVNGTPTFVDLTTSADLLVGRVGLGGVATSEWTWTGAIATGQSKTLTNLVWVMPGA